MPQRGTEGYGDKQCMFKCFEKVRSVAFVLRTVKQLRNQAKTFADLAFVLMHSPQEVKRGRCTQPPSVVRNPKKLPLSCLVGAQWVARDLVWLS